MIAGIYLLKFNYAGSEYQYVGKSVCIERRLAEHVESFLKGKASKKLQNMYNLVGLPEAILLQRCHPDHIDVVEAYYINFYRGPYCLNTVDMSNPFHHVCPSEHAEYLNKSTDMLIAELAGSEIVIADNEEVIETLNEEIKELERKRSDEELQADVDGRIHDLKTELDNKKLYIEQILGRIEEFEKLPWYKKLFTKPL